MPLGTGAWCGEGVDWSHCQSAEGSSDWTAGDLWRLGSFGPQMAKKTTTAVGFEKQRTWVGPVRKAPSDPNGFSTRRSCLVFFWNFQVNPTDFNSYHTTSDAWSLSHWTCCEHWSWYSLNIIEHLTYRVATLVVYQLYVFRFGWIFVTWRMLWLVTTVTNNISTGTMIFALIDSLDARFFGTSSLIQTHFESEKL